MSEKPEKFKMGRPTIYTPEIGTEIELRLAHGQTLIRISKEMQIDRTTIHLWASDPKHDFFDKYARGRNYQADTYADEIIEIADDAKFDWVERQTKSGEVMTVADFEHIQRSRLRVDARKWIAAKLAPRKYSEKIRTEDETPPENKVPTVFKVKWADEEDVDVGSNSAPAQTDPAAKED